MTEAVRLPQAPKTAPPKSKIVPAEMRKPRSLWSDAWTAYRRHRMAMIGTIVLAILIVAVVVGPVIWPTDVASVGDFANAFQAPSISHPMGTDPLGRDLMSMVLYGGRVSIAVTPTYSALRSYSTCINSILRQGAMILVDA